MAVKIRLKRMGKIRAPFYRVVVMDSRTKRDGRAIEEIGKYHPTAEPSVIDIDSARAQYWLGVGAQPTEQVQALLTVTGDWQRFKGETGAEGTLKPQPSKTTKKERYEAAMAAAGAADADYEKSGPTTRRKTSAEKPKADESKAHESKAYESKAEPRGKKPKAEDAAAAADEQPARAETVVAQAAADNAEGAAAVEVAAVGDEGSGEDTAAPTTETSGA